MMVTMDTNVLFAALTSGRGASNVLLNLVFAEKVALALSLPIVLEYEAVLTRPENSELLRLSSDQVPDLVDFLALLAKKSDSYFLWRPNLRDETDNIFWECAFTSGSQYLITANTKGFQNAQLINLTFEIVTPAQFISLWRTHHA